jgi:hypothetical protein
MIHAGRNMAPAWMPATERGDLRSDPTILINPNQFEWRPDRMKNVSKNPAGLRLRLDLHAGICDAGCDDRMVECMRQTHDVKNAACWADYYDCLGSCFLVQQRFAIPQAAES